MKKVSSIVAGLLLMGLLTPVPAVATAVDDVDIPISFDNPVEKEKFERYLRAEEAARELEDPQQEGGSAGIGTARTTNEVRNYDQRIGALYWSRIPFASRYCTAFHIGGRYWMTAKHCLDWVDEDRDKLNSYEGFILTSDNHYAGIESLAWIDNHDFAILRMGQGLDHKPSFSLPYRSIPNGTVVTVNGFYNEHKYQSSSKYRSLGYYGENSCESTVYHGQTRFSKEPGEFALGGGDSGAPIYSDNTVWAITSCASGLDKGKKKRPYDPTGPQTIWGTETYYHKGWIKDTRNRLKEGSDVSKVLNSYRGRYAASSMLATGGGF